MYSDPVARSNNADGQPNALVRGQHLHSTRDPRREAERIAAEIARTLQEGRPCVLVGVGCGHVVRAALALDQVQNAPLRFFEPFTEARGLFSPPGELGLADPAALVDFLRQNPGAGLFVAPTWRRLLPNIESDIASLLSGGAERTRRHFFRQWTRNFFGRLRENDALAYLNPADAADIPSANTSASGRTPPAKATIVHCGAGPGLFEDLNSFSELLHKPGTMVTAVDSALAPLLNAGIEPDLVLSVDSGRGTALHLLAAAQLTDAAVTIPVLTWTAGFSRLGAFANQVLYYRSSLPYEQWLGEGPLSDVTEFSNPSENAAGLALIVARAMGASQVCLAGTDFISRGSQTHVRGTGYDTYAHLRQHRLRPAETYRVRIYAQEPDAAARRNRRGLKEMAERFGIELLHPHPSGAKAGTQTANQKDSAKPPRAKVSGNLPPRKRQAFTLVTTSVSTAAMDGFLRNHFGRLPLSQLPDLGRTATRLLARG